MRISFILSSLRLSGGVRVIVEYANRLAARGHLVTLVVSGDTLDPEMVGELSSEVRVLESRDVLREPMTARHKVRLAWSLARTVPPSDVVISTHTPTTVAGLLAARCWRRGKLVWLYQDFLEMFDGRPYESWLLRHALSWHECALVVSEYSRCELGAYAPGKTIVVGEALSHSEYFRPRPPEEPGQNSCGRTILFLGDMRARKGLHDFLQAAALVYSEIPDVKLLIISKDSCHIEGDVSSECLYRPSRAELARRYSACDLFVSASWRESFGLPPLEAMACGAPVVLTDSGGVREYARHEYNCLMVPVRDPEALANAMVRVLTDAALAERLRRNGPPTAARFTWDSAVDRFEEALKSVLAARQATGQSHG